LPGTGEPHKVEIDFGYLLHLSNAADGQPLCRVAIECVAIRFYHIGPEGGLTTPGETMLTLRWNYPESEFDVVVENLHPI
jgi:hypothetical protein